jgi:maleylacetate reductase
MSTGQRFVHEALAVRVVFGAGRLAGLPDELDRLGLSRLLVLSTPGHVELAASVADRLGGRVAGLHQHAVMHVPVQAADRAVGQPARRGPTAASPWAAARRPGKAIALRRACRWWRCPLRTRVRR